MNDNEASLLAMASRSRGVNVAGREIHIQQFDYDSVCEFQPTLVVDCAFVTRERTVDFPISQYIEINRNLTQSMVKVIELPSVRAAISISSGAAVHPHDALEDSIGENPYGYLKREAENIFSAKATEIGIGWSIGRAWSVSGALITKPGAFAISDMILQARTGTVNISSTREVYRRYSSVEDFLALALAEATADGNSVLNSEGTLVEIQELAEMITQIVNPHAVILRPPLEAGIAHDYYSRSNDWPKLATQHGLDPANLFDQISTMNMNI
jgi:nucleoside-diphosphate-sugar epimerase